MYGYVTNFSYEIVFLFNITVYIINENLDVKYLFKH